jgi:hypothetical protein
MCPTGHPVVQQMLKGACQHVRQKACHVRIVCHVFHILDVTLQEHRPFGEPTTGSFHGMMSCVSWISIGVIIPWVATVNGLICNLINVTMPSLM